VSSWIEVVTPYGAPLKVRKVSPAAVVVSEAASATFSFAPATVDGRKAKAAIMAAASAALAPFGL
jgi:RNA 3'-terminal phosphate cyclase